MGTSTSLIVKIGVPEFLAIMPGTIKMLSFSLIVVSGELIISNAFSRASPVFENKRFRIDSSLTYPRISFAGPVSRITDTFEAFILAATALISAS